MSIYILNEVSCKNEIILKEEQFKNGILNVKFEAVLQTFGVPNRNKRIYTEETGRQILEQMRVLINEGKCLGEMDHPIDDSPERQSKVLYKEAAFMITGARMEGNKLIGECKTLSNRVGQDLAALIRDGVKVGFSLRALGFNIEQKNGLSIVKPPVMYIAYDAVTIPSHPGADLIEIKEDFERVVCNSDECHLVAFKESLEHLKNNTFKNSEDEVSKLIEEIFY